MFKLRIHVYQPNWYLESNSNDLDSTQESPVCTRVSLLTQSVGTNSGSFEFLETPVGWIYNFYAVQVNSPVSSRPIN